MINIEPIKVLHIVGNMNMGGQETFIMNVYRKINKNKIQFDFVVHSEKRGFYDDEIESMGGKIYRIPRLSDNIIKYIYCLKKIIKENNYEIIHRHTASSIAIIDLWIAKICKVKKRIVHSHSNNIETKKIIHKLLRGLLNQLANKRFACSKQAGEWLYKNGEYTVIPNGINIDKFLYNNETKKKIRQIEKSKDKIIIGHVGRFENEKNHKFIIEVFNELIKENKNLELWLIGKGSLENEIKKQVKKLNLKDSVKFLGIKDNVNEYMQSMDIFLFPSIYEGLGIVLLEAQISGLKCIVSENIPNEAIITNNVNKIELDKYKWKRNILSIIDNKDLINDRKIDLQNEKLKKYDINEVVKILTNYYLS